MSQKNDQRKLIFGKYGFVFRTLSMFGQSTLDSDLKSSKYLLLLGVCEVSFYLYGAAISLYKLETLVGYASSIHLSFDKIRLVLMILTVFVGLLETWLNRSKLDLVYKELENLKDLSIEKYLVRRKWFIVTILILLSCCVYTFFLDSAVVLNRLTFEIFIVAFTYDYLVFSMNLIAIKISLNLYIIGSYLKSCRDSIDNLNNSNINKDNLFIDIDIKKRGKEDEMIKLIIYQKRLMDCLELINESFKLQLSLLVLTSFLQVTGLVFARIKNIIQPHQGEELDAKHHHADPYHHVKQLLKTIIDIGVTGYNVIVIVRAADNIDDKTEDFRLAAYKTTRQDQTDILVKNEKLMEFFEVNPRVEFTACNLFKLDYALVMDMIAAAATYVVVLLQFSMSNKCSQ